MRNFVLGCALVLSVAGCDLGMDLTGLGDAFSCTNCWDVGGGGGGGWGGGSGRSSGYYSGRIAIGPYRAVEGEATTYVYDPSDLTVPVDSSQSDPYGSYTLYFGTEPSPAVCGYLAQVVLWNGETSELAPLFSTAPSPCDSLSTSNEARDFTLPAYSPLDTPFTLEGAVLFDGLPAGEGVRVDILTRPMAADSVPTFGSDCPLTPWSFFSVRRNESVFPPSALCVSVSTDASGHFIYLTTDPAQLFVLCDLAIAIASEADGTRLQRQLESTPRSACAHRRFHDFRFGSQGAASGTVRVLEPNRWATTGEAYVEMLDPSDSSRIGEPGWTLDDGSFFLWFPPEIVEPPCDLLLRATFVGRGSQIQARSPGATATSCPGDYLHLLEVSATDN